MADLVTTISESVTLNGAVRGTSNSVTTTGIVDVMERIVTCAHSNTTTIAIFNSTPHGAAGALDLENAKYIRVTNLDDSEVMDLAVVTENTNYQVVITAGNSHILCQADTAAIGEEDTTPAFGTLEDVTSLQIRPRGTEDIQVELFVGLV
ncbi:MAG: hypothetical protein Unbinned3065contig1007_4 [Prokaryotic dsDNA virus sp.]|nr:MAG: hypothetical protein Unbinned3065contig1007_4 [Prokaryotic dsDNA virus sp.]|tara:strand:- start:3588 stop:4037 length:450 start_codon:yes stop_codon:yes gene_type:complete